MTDRLPLQVESEKETRDLRELFETALEWAEAKGIALRELAKRTAISAEDWRYTNGFDAALRYFQTPALLSALSESSASEPDTARPPTAEQQERFKWAANERADRLSEAATEVLRAADACRDAVNGLGHPGTEHDRVLHFGPYAGGVEIYDAVGDCAACGGAQYGTEDALNEAYAALRVALGQPCERWTGHSGAHQIAANARRLCEHPDEARLYERTTGPWFRVTCPQCPDIRYVPALGWTEPRRGASRSEPDTGLDVERLNG